MLRIKGKWAKIIYYVQCKILFSSKTTVKIKIDLFFNIPIFYCRFAIFRRCFDAETKDSPRCSWLIMMINYTEVLVLCSVRFVLSHESWCPVKRHENHTWFWYVIENTCGFHLCFDWVSKLMYVTNLAIFYWLSNIWIINKL